ncbi:RagB/SusD family nutrient uptake outer membrane protein [Dyadobacter psychrotolerans]|uniref:RagB/SusD family nutrient uptake outer membrane protein n=1 Tax=Dyadobacter psychrotolerans TaxID=2541721 RepID=A0A4R5DDW9_9BACT|nr:RagB/SusD family nutrient uptake outer membrane protein [Dyadobacter psychrotolerans]TDE11267.1 RagB/SusD family nutrient uptake outer membrane protein [Dyadobacter psychrotolerans]
MNFFRYKINNALIVIMMALFAVSCNDYLDQAPLSSITPDAYLREESQLAAYAVARYPDVLPSHANWTFGTFGTDGNTDNMAIPALDNKYVPGLWRVGASGGDWSFNNIFQLNYFIQTVVPRLKNGELTGNDANIRHYLGEVYFLRAHEYFNKLQAVGDFPILKNTLPDNQEVLTAASTRNPRNEVARFIISDLDSAALLMKETAPTGGKNRISKNVALLLKSRVALYEGTWLKYFKGTAYVPKGPEWPGNGKSYNASYQFPSGSIDGEISYFLTQAMASAKEVASKVALVQNTEIIEAPVNENPYLNMFGAVDMSSYSEVLLWRQYNLTLVTHNVPVNAMAGNYAVGLTRSMTESFLMDNGLPIYATGSGYKGDDYLTDVRQGRDGRLKLFLKEPGQKNVLLNQGKGSHETAVEPTPQIWESSYEKKYSTGYTIRKGINYDGQQAANGSGYTGSITFRAVEAYLNYMEASYEKNGVLDADAKTYWQAIRARAKVSTDVDKTIAATQMTKETLDWGAYSANQLISPTLYNIRRERRNELMAEGLRYMDLKRWRAMDQMINTPYHVEGFKLWGPMKSWFTAAQLTYGATNNAAVVSDPALGLYLRPHQIRSNADSYKGTRWTMAHYLNPIAAQHFIITATGGDVSTSPIYQNPGWPLTAGSAPNGL